MANISSSALLSFSSSCEPTELSWNDYIINTSLTLNDIQQQLPLILSNAMNFRVIPDASGKIWTCSELGRQSEMTIITIQIIKTTPLAITLRTDGGDQFTGGKVIAKIVNCLKNVDILSQDQPHQQERVDMMSRWAMLSSKAVMDYQMNRPNSSVPCLPEHPVNPSFMPVIRAIPAIPFMPIKSSSLISSVLSKSNSEMWDVRIDALNQLVGMISSGEFQRLVMQTREEEKQEPGSVVEFSINLPMSEDGGAVDILITILRQCLVDQKRLIVCSFQVMRLCSTALANLIEYVNPLDSMCPRARVSRAAMNRLSSVDGFRTIQEVALMAMTNDVQVLIDDRENSATFRAQLASDTLRVILASIRHLIQQLTAIEHAASARQVVERMKPGLVKVLIACHAYKEDATLGDMISLFTATVVKLISQVRKM